MDAAQKLLKASAILLAFALLMAAPGWAVPTLVVNPTTVAIGTTGFNTANVTSSDGMTVITYTIGTPSYTGGDPAWLYSITGSTTTPATLSFYARNSGLSAGVHTATVVLYPTNGAPNVTVTVTYDNTGGGGGGGSTSLS